MRRPTSALLRSLTDDAYRPGVGVRRCAQRQIAAGDAPEGIDAFPLGWWLVAMNAHVRRSVEFEVDVGPASAPPFLTRKVENWERRTIETERSSFESRGGS